MLSESRWSNRDRDRRSLHVMRFYVTFTIGDQEFFLKIYPRKSDIWSPPSSIEFFYDARLDVLLESCILQIP